MIYYFARVAHRTQEQLLDHRLITKGHNQEQPMEEIKRARFVGAGPGFHALGTNTLAACPHVYQKKCSREEGGRFKREGTYIYL